MAAASGGVKEQVGTWSDASADAGGTGALPALRWTAPPRRRERSAHLGTDMIVDNTSFLGQSFPITQFDITAGNA